MSGFLICEDCGNDYRDYGDSEISFCTDEKCLEDRRKSMKKTLNQASRMQNNLPTWLGGKGGTDKKLIKAKKKIKELKTIIKKLEEERDKAWMVIF